MSCEGLFFINSTDEKSNLRFSPRLKTHPGETFFPPFLRRNTGFYLIGVQEGNDDKKWKKRWVKVTEECNVFLIFSRNFFFLPPAILFYARATLWASGCGAFFCAYEENSLLLNSGKMCTWMFRFSLKIFSKKK